jgi:hypothetical protein
MTRIDQDRGPVDVAYHTYVIRAEEADEPPAEAEGIPANGLIAAAPDYISVYTGLHTGDISLTLETWQDEPPLDLDAWEEVVEVSFTSTTGDAKVVDEWTDSPVPIDLNLAFAGPGEYRLRAHARGRDLGRDEDTQSADDGDTLVEHHLLQAWPASPGSELILKATDDVGAEARSMASEE